MPKTERALRRYSKMLTLLGVFFSCLLFQSSLSAQCGTMVCNNVLQISIDQNCEIAFNADLLLEGDPVTQGTSFSLTIADLGINEQALDLTANVPIGTYEYKVTNECGNSCWGNFFAENNLTPQLDGVATCTKDMPCEFSCNELQAILNNSLLTSHINPDFTNYCADGLDITFEDTFIKSTDNCGIDTIKREWIGQVDKHGSQTKLVITTQYLVFNPVSLDDVWMPAGTVTVPCHITEDPDSLVNYLDDPWTCENEGIENTMPHIMGNPILCDECKPIEIHFEYLKEYKEDQPLLVEGPDGNDQWILIDQWIKDIDSRKVCGCDEWDALLDEVKDVYSEVGEIVKIKSPFPGALDAEGKCTSWPSTSHFLTDPTSGSGIGVITGSGTGVLPDPHTSDNHIGLYGENSLTCNLLTTKEDLIIPLCEHGGSVSSYKVIRTWSVYDWCSGDIKKSVQVIIVEDLEGPTFVIADSLSLSTDPWLCGLNFEVPPPTELTDKCSPDNISYSVAIDGLAGLDISGTSSTGYTILDIPKGDHKLIYTVSDNCGNTSLDTTLLWIKDNVPPVAIAKENIVVSLTSSGNNVGQAKVFYNSINNGSYDLCGPVKIVIKRETHSCGIADNLIYGDFVKFCCEDLTNGHYGIHKVLMRVYDDANMDGTAGNDGDNYSDLWANVRVESKLNPVITCPADKVVDCNVALDNLTVLGQPDVISVCGANLIYEDDLPGSHCITGTVIRKWFADKDHNERFDIGEKFCKQSITITDPNPMFCDDLIYPKDTIVDCANASMDSAPIWPEDRCGLFGFSEEVDVFDLQDQYCYKIIRRFTVIDWCQYNPNNGSDAGVCRGSQTIIVSDSSAPTFPACEDKIVESADAECVVSDLVVSQTAVDEGDCLDKTLRWTICLDIDSNNSCDYNYTAITQSGDNLDVALVDDMGNALSMISGTHSVTWTVTDACDNTSSCSSKLIIADKKAPTPICIEAISTAVMSNNGSIEIWATDFDPNKKSFDNCDKSLTYSFSGEEIISNLTISCSPAADTIGSIKDGLFITNGQSETFELQMWVWDDGYDEDCDGTISMEERNKDWCTVKLRVDDNVNACADTEGSSAAVISGEIHTDNGEMVEDVQVMIQSTHPEYPSMMITPNTGVYAFSNNPMDSDYEISAQRDDDYMNGVSTLDLVLIQKHILGLNILNSPYKVIASDVNNDQKVTGADLVELRKLILGIYAELPNNDSWRFVEEALVFQSAVSPFPFTEEIEIFDLVNDMNDQDFVGVKIGDVNGNVTANSLQQTEVRSKSRIVLSAQNQRVTKGEQIQIDFSSAEFSDVYGMQFSVSHAGLRLVDALAGEINITEDNIGIIREGELSSFSWHNIDPVSSEEILFSFVFEAEETVDLSSVININSQVTQAEAYTSEQYILNDISLRFDNVDYETDFVLYQNEPNPFSNNTSISFNLPEASDVALKVFDVTGKLVMTKSESYPKGLSTIELNSDDLSSTGILYYQLDAGKYSATKKMVMIK